MDDDNVRDLPPRPLTENERRVLELVESSEVPPVPKEHLDILERPTPKQLLLCLREATSDRNKHIRKKHPGKDKGTPVDTSLQRLMESLLAEPNPPIESENALDGLRLAASQTVSRYWTHVTEGHISPAESEEEYLRGLVERIQRESA